MINLTIKELANLKEEDLFKIVKENHIPDLEMMQDPISREDAWSLECRARVELKCRSSHYDEFMIEKGKHDFLVNKCRRRSELPIYICSSPKGIFIWDLSLLDIEWKTMKLQKTTSWDRSKVDKIVGFIKIDQSFKLYYKK